MIDFPMHVLQRYFLEQPLGANPQPLVHAYLRTEASEHLNPKHLEIDFPDLQALLKPASA
jgi:hypothetical protein